MSALESLPDEIGLMIWEYIILPDDIDSYSLVCPPIRALATKILPEHQRLKRQLTLVGNSQSALIGEPRGTCYLEIFQLLELVTINPSHAPYVKNLTIESWHDSFETKREFKARLGRDERPRFEAYASKTQLVLKRAILDSMHLHPGLISRRFGHLERGDEALFLAILLTLLPSLASLKILKVGVDHKYLPRFVNEIKDGPMLPNLTSIELLETLVRWKQGYWETLRAFSNLPSVRSIKAHKLKDGDKLERHEIVKFCRERNSRVTDLDLQDCKLNEKTLHQVLSRFTSLVSFTYSWQDHMQDTDHFDPSALRCALLDCSRVTLIRLDLHSNQGNSANVGDLSEFRVLKYLRIDFMLVSGGLPSHLLLPSSLEEFHLHNESCWQSPRYTLDEVTKDMFNFGVFLLASDNMRHPKLKTMTMRGNQSSEDLRLATMALNQRPDVSLTLY